MEEGASVEKGHGKDYGTLSDKEAKNEMTHDTMSLQASIFNLAKVLMGAGMLALPSGMAAGQGTGFIPAILILALSAVSSGYTFYTIGISLQVTKTSSFKELLVHTLGPKMGIVIDTIIIIFGLTLGVLYLDFVGDLFSALLKSFSMIPAWLATRDLVILLATAAILVPLCLQKDLHALRHSSYFGVAAVLYITAFMTIRLLDGSYKSGGIYSQEDSVGTQSLDIGLWQFGLGTAVLTSMLTTSFIAHQNAPQFASQLDNFTPIRFGTVVLAAFSITVALDLAVMSTGFLSFGMSSQGLVLDNYSESDSLATLARFATGMSVLCSSPIIFAAYRESVNNCLESVIRLGFTKLTLLLIILQTCICMVFRDIGFIVSMIGTLTGGPLVFILPGMVYLKVLKRYSESQKVGNPTIVLNFILIAFGYFLTIFATIISILNTYTTLLK